MLKRFNLNTRAKRLALVARHADPYEERPRIPPPERHIDATRPGEKVGVDHRVARELKAAGWRLECVISGNGSEFAAREFTCAVEAAGATHRRIRAGRPTSNGHVERLQQTILEECWRPAFARSVVPKLTALELDLADYLRTYNFDRAHTGRLTKGRVPADIVFGARKTRTVR